MVHTYLNVKQNLCTPLYDNYSKSMKFDTVCKFATRRSAESLKNENEISTARRPLNV